MIGHSSTLSTRARHRARRAAVQALYQWQLTGQDIAEIEIDFLSAKEKRRIDIDYFHSLLNNVPTRVSTLDAALAPLLDRPIRQLDPVERAILRMGAFELMFVTDTPWRVVINEAVELAKTFGAEQSHKYVNGILDRIARDARAEEIARSNQQEALHDEPLNATKK